MKERYCERKMLARICQSLEGDKSSVYLIEYSFSKSTISTSKM